MIRPLYIVWKDEFNVNVPIIDEQHRAVVATINSLYYFIQEGWGLNALEPTLRIIKMYSSFHAKTEEGMLAHAQCESIDDHIATQAQFEHNVLEAKEEAMELKDPQILLTFLRKWWLKHLNEEHKQYAQYYETTPAEAE